MGLWSNIWMYNMHNGQLCLGCTYRPTRKTAEHTKVQKSRILWRQFIIIGQWYRLAELTLIPFNGLLSVLPGWAGTRKVKLIWILLKQETVSGSGISWAVCKSAPRSRQITTPAPHHSVFYRPDALPVAQPTASKHWRHVQDYNELLGHNFCQR